MHNSNFQQKITHLVKRKSVVVDDLKEEPNGEITLVRNEELYLVYSDAKGDSRLELGVFVEEDEAVSHFVQKVKECQKQWESAHGDCKVVKIGSPQKKEVCWSHKDFSQTWHFQKIRLNKIQPV